MDQTQDTSLREHLVKLMDGGEAHLRFDDLVEGFPVERCGEKISRLPYTAWQVLEHIRIAQWDIVEFARNAHYVSPKWPEGYWPKPNELGDETLWKGTVAKIKEDLAVLIKIIQDPSTDLFARIPHGTGQTWLRQALLTADHNSNHLGSLTVMKRLLAE